MSHKFKLNTDLLLSVDEDFIHKYHSRKLIAKLREVFLKNKTNLFYREFPS